MVQAYFGADTRYKRVVAALKKSKYLDNIFFIREDVKNLLTKISDNKLKEVHIYFPDPWPKKKHYKNRLLNSDFLKLLYTKMDTNSTLFFKTDHNSYFEWAKSNIEELFNIVKHTNDLEKDDIFEYGGIKTEFESMFANKNQKINAILAIKKSNI